MEPFIVYNQSFSHDYHQYVLQDSLLSQSIGQNVEFQKKFDLKSQNAKKTKKDLEKEKQRSKNKQNRPFT